MDHSMNSRVELIKIMDISEHKDYLDDTRNTETSECSNMKLKKDELPPSMHSMQFFLK